MTIKQIVNLASFYAKKVKNGEFKANRAKQEIKSANQNSFTHLKNNQKAEYSKQIKPQSRLNGLRGMRFAEYGRSMVEMLGVLAVIGVLSVAGITGYRYAMDKYRSNDIVYEVNLRATDIWNRYQRMPLPEPSESGKDFLEFAQTTASGFPISMQSKPDVAFRVFVEEVSPTICKDVLNMPLINVIKGLQFVQVNDVKYTGNVEICGDMNGNIQNEMVFTIFLNSESDSLINENCVEDGDCSSCCGTPMCDENTLTCRDECSGNASTPYCKQDECACVECLTQKDCTEKGTNYTCSEITNTCVEVPAECAFGKEFRTPNGVCVPCNNPNNFLVSLTPFENSALDFKDEQSGKEQCAACTNPTRFYGDVDDEKAYCSYACTNGYTYQASDGAGCVPCSDKTPHTISGDAVSKAQCLACGEDRFWFYNVTGNYYCLSTTQCNKEEFLYADTVECIPCERDTYNYYINTNASWISSNVGASYLADLCNKCQNRTARMSNAYCMVTCEQPNNAPESCNNPEYCNRVWQYYNGQCLPCNDSSTNGMIYAQDTVQKELCTACGRKLIEYTSQFFYCSYEETCSENQFKGKDGKCYPCTQNGGVLIDEDDTNCEMNCKNSTNPRWKGVDPQGNTYCYPTCSLDTIQNSGGACLDCLGYEIFTPMNLEECEKICGETHTLFGSYCARKKCPSDGSYYQDNTGKCYRCDGEDTPTISDNSIAQSSCLACGNRMIIDGKCVKVAPGNNGSGICSSLDGPLPNELDSSLVSKAQPYLKGEHEGELFRGNDYKCYSCMDEGVAPKTSSAQCALCSNRRYDSTSSCSYGKCEETHQFLDTNNTCRDCSEKNIAVNPNEDNLCDSCDNRREMTLGNSATNNLTAKCVEECTPGLWQDSNGNCLLCSEGGNRAIGTDSESIALCNSCDNREAVASTNADGVITAYTCKQH